MSRLRQGKGGNVSNLLVNGTFDTALTPWGTLGSVIWYNGAGDPGAGCASLNGNTAQIFQNPVAGTTAGWYWFVYRLRNSTVVSTPIGRCEIASGPTVPLQYYWYVSSQQDWFTRFRHKVYMPTGTWFYNLYCQQSGVMMLDTIGMFAATGQDMESLKEELRKRRRDVAEMIHNENRYEAALNTAIQDYPMKLWARKIDTSLATIADTTRYSLAGLTDLTGAGQVRRIWMEDRDGHDRRIGNWGIEDDEGALTLVLHKEPASASRTLTLEYRIPPTGLVHPWDETELDRQWILARATTNLLLEADSTEDPRGIDADLQRWDAVRQARERELLNQTPRISTRIKRARYK